MSKWTSQDTEVGRITAVVVRVVLDDLNGRQGLKHELGAIRIDSPAVHREMMNTLHRKVWEALVNEIGLDPDH